MSSDEEDYMSEKFLSQCVQQDVRPGLIRVRKHQREVEVAAKKLRTEKEAKLKAKPNEKERLKEGLGVALNSSNKGFALLAKMGYKQGESLGKSSDGIVEPIAISIKSDRSGLGREAAIRELNAKKQEIRRRKLLEKANVPKVTVEEHRQRMMQKSKDGFIIRALRRLQLTCEKLDSDEKILEPEMTWFWPEREKLEENDEDASEEEKEDSAEDCEYVPAEKLSMLSAYLRSSYNYCHWCGTQYEDQDDLVQNCPGPNEEDH